MGKTNNCSALPSMILVDTDVWVGFLIADDSNHKKAVKYLNLIRKRKQQIIITSAIVGEAITVLSYKSGQDLARQFLKYAIRPDEGGLINLQVKDKDITQALNIFAKQDKKGTSYVDCTNVAMIRAFNIKQILAFDKVYHKKFNIDNTAYPKNKASRIKSQLAKLGKNRIEPVC